MAMATELPMSGVLAPEERSVISGSVELLLVELIAVTGGALTFMFVGCSLLEGLLDSRLMIF